MSVYWLLLLWLTMPTKSTSNSFKLGKYLEIQSKIIHDKMDAKMRVLRQTDAKSEELDILGSYKHPDVSPDPTVNIFTFFNKTFFAINDEIFLGTLGKTFNMNVYGSFEHEEMSRFKAFEYQNTGFIALSTSHETSIYIMKKNSSSPDLIQKIATFKSTDSIFFVNRDSLYFISSTFMGEHSGYITLYKWLGSHFDEIENVATTGVVTLSSFPYKFSEIIIVLRSLPGNMKVHSSIYEFKQDTIRKIQQLETNKPRHMNIFLQKSVPYMLIYEGSNNQTLYKWNGFEMVLVNRFQWEHKVDKSIVVYSNTIPLIVQPQLDRILIFIPHGKNIRLHKTKNYLANYSVILDINKGVNENGNITFIAGLNEDNIINIYGMSFKAHVEMETEQEEALRNCFDNLERKVYDRRKKLNQISNSLVEVQLVDGDVPNSRKRQANLNFNTNDTDIENKLKDLKRRLTEVRPFITNHDDPLNHLVVNGKAVIKGNIVTKKVKAKKMLFNVVNERDWTPKQWLRYRQEQTIKGPVIVDRIFAKVVVTNATLFQNLLRESGNQTILSEYKINNLFATKIISKHINNIAVDDIYKKTDNVPIKGTKSFKNIMVNKANIKKINDKVTEDILHMLLNNNMKPNFTFAPNLNITALDVESIDNINWAEFETTVFTIGNDDLIEGNLIGSSIKTTNLYTKRVNGVNTNDFMTKSTDQIINSTIEFNNIKAASISCRTVNDVDITKSVPIDQNGTVIKGHVELQEIDVLHDLQLDGKMDKSFFLKESDHIYGTNESDLLQRYLGKIVINGNLYVDNFKAFPNTTIFVREKEYSMKVLDEYWNKDSSQVIPVHFEAQNGVSTPHLKTKSLNEIPVELFALNNNKSVMKSPLFFENVTVVGNVVLVQNNTNNSFDLQKLAKEGVKNDGKAYNITGEKIFRNTLVVNHLESKNGIMENNASSSENKANLGNRRKKVIVKGNLIANISAAVINNINITKYTRSILPLNKPQKLAHLTMENIAAENLYVETINGLNVNEYLAKLQDILSRKQIGTVNLTGNLHLGQVQGLKNINSYDIDIIFDKEISQPEAAADFTGDVEFSKKVKVGNLKARVINDINFPNLTRRLLYKKSNQTVSGFYTFRNLNTAHLHTDNINEKNITNLIDASSTRRQQLRAPKGITFKNVRLEKSVKAKDMWPCDINEAMEGIRYPGTQEWSAVEIYGNVTLLDESCELMKILKKSVRKGRQNIITAPVTIRGHALSERVQTNAYLNDINLAELIKDAVLMDSEEEQVITGHKIFKNVINANTVDVLENADIPVVNDIYIPELYKKIIKKDQVNNITILGKKTFFNGLKTDRCLTQKIGGVNLENIVDLKNLRKIPSAFFDSIEVLNDFNVKIINSYELDYILNNRLFTNTTERQLTNAVYFFDDLEFRDNLKTTAINNVEIKDVVFDIGKQKITGAKRFTQNIIVLGNASIGYLNGVNISEAYNNALLRGKSEIINGSITILNPVWVEGNISAQMLNGYPIEKIKEIMNQTSNQAEESAILDLKEKVKYIIEERLPEIKYTPNEFMYIERANDLQLEIHNALDARVTTIKDYALVHILSEDSSEKCKLPDGCECSVQHTVEISPELSVSYFLNKGSQRIYSYDDDTLTIHLTTNSVSTSSRCRTNQTEKFTEVASLTWSSTTTGNTTGSFNIYPVFITGYISGAEFFTLNGVTYAVIARYYDPILDTHDLDCTVIRFNEDKTSASEIQKIPTHGVWTLYLLHTAQGIVIVIGNIAERPYTEIYRFNQKIEKFELLRSVSYVCTKAVGVVLGTDSLIILANKDEPLQVLKYQPNWDNYYYYQMFALDEPVLGISVFYIGGFGISEAYLCIVTEENYRIYSFQYIDGWKLESNGVIRGLRKLIPFELNDQLYLFAPSHGESQLLRVLKYGADRS